jgi:flagellar FliL protein
MVAALGVGNFLLFAACQSEIAPSGGGVRVKRTLHLDTFVLNLADPGQRSYLRVGIDLGLGIAKTKPDENLPISQVRDTILGVLSQYKAEDLLTEEGKARLKKAMLRSLQDRLPELAVKDVYFTEFLIQR